MKLMKLVKLSIQLNSRPFFVTGLKYFCVTLVAVLKVTIKEFKFEMGYHVIYCFFTDNSRRLLLLYFLDIDSLRAFIKIHV